MANSAFVQFLDYCAHKVPSLEEMLAEKKGKEIVVVDVGSGAMPYADSLHAWAEQYGKPRIFAVDMIYKNLPDYRIKDFFVSKPKKPLTIVQRSIEECSDYFSLQEKLSHVDLFTIFNPSKGAKFPDVTKLDVSRRSLLLIALDGAEDVENYFSSELKRQGIAVLSQFSNPYSGDIKSEIRIGHWFTPVIIARAP
ncbi:MAG: hypothetical protein V1702_01775 [Candidatus Woesearchaeota archaeon]